MIFVTVGTHTQGFDRLLKAADDYASISTEKIDIQTGNSTYQPVYANSFRWATSDEIEKIIKKSRIVVSHAGAGTIIQVLKLGKPLVVAPRQRKYGENHNDHQYQLAHALEQEHRAVMLEEINCGTFQSAIKLTETLLTIEADPQKLAFALQKQINLWSEPKNVF
jgi:beta-1,4-N-acetylglucosaminyltransferase